jgi:Flp pilus assembly protein TadD
MIYLGDTYVRQDQFDLGKSMLEKAARYPTPDSLIHLDLGIVYMETGDNPAALRELNKAVELEPDNITAHFRLATLYRSIGKKDEAKAEFVKANSLNKQKDDSVHQRIAAANARPRPVAGPAQTQPNANRKPDQP